MIHWENSVRFKTLQMCWWHILRWLWKGKNRTQNHFAVLQSFFQAIMGKPFFTRCRVFKHRLTGLTNLFFRGLNYDRILIPYLLLWQTFWHFAYPRGAVMRFVIGHRGYQYTTQMGWRIFHLFITKYILDECLWQPPTFRGYSLAQLIYANSVWE